MRSTENIEDGVLGEGIEESKLNSGSQVSPDESLQQKEDETPRTVHGFQWAFVCVSLYTVSIIYGLDTTIAADIQAAIVERFDSVERLTWVGTAFPLGSVCAISPT